MPQQGAQLQRRFCVTDREGIQPIGSKLSLRTKTSTCDQTAIRSLSLLFNDIHPRSPCNYNTCITTHLPIPKGWKAELAWLVDQ